MWYSAELEELTSSKNNNTMNTPGYQAFEQACKLLKEEGVNVVAVMSTYTKEDAHFSTKISVQENEEAGVNEQHIMWDSIREIVNQWDQVAHK